MNIAIYSRKSKFTGKGESIENQLELCQEYAQRQFGDDCQFFVYQDEGFSAKNTDRPMFQKMMEDIRAKKINTLICYRLDRISRSVSDFSSVLDELERCKISFISIRESFDTTSPMGRAMIYIASVFAQLERETIAERVKDNRGKLAYTGRWQGGFAPLGYQTQKVETSDENGKKHSHYVLIEDKNTSEFIRELFPLYLKFSSLAKLEQHYHSEIPKGVLGQYLRNPAYATNTEMTYDYFQSLGAKISNPRDDFDGKHGLLAYNRTQSYSKDSKRRRLPEQEWIIAIGEHTGLVHGDLWVNVQKLRKENQKKHPRWQSSNCSLLSGFLRCKTCGAPIKIQNQRLSKHGVKNFYYVCTCKQNSKSLLCSQRNISGIPYDQAFTASLKKILQNMDNLSLYLRPAKTRNKDLERKIANHNTAIQNLIRKLSSSPSPTISKHIQTAIEELDQENQTLQVQLEQQCQTNRLEQIQAAIQDFVDHFDVCLIQQKKFILQNCIKEIDASRETSVVELRSPIF